MTPAQTEQGTASHHRQEKSCCNFLQHTSTFFSSLSYSLLSYFLYSYVTGVKKNGKIMILWAFLRRYLSKQKKRSWFKSLVKVDCFLNRFSLWSYSGAESVMLSDTSMCLTAFGWYYCQRDKIEIDFISGSADFTFHRHRRKQKVAVILFPFQQFFLLFKRNILPGWKTIFVSLFDYRKREMSLFQINSI